MNKPYFCRNFFLTDWRHKRLKNKIDLLLFYKKDFYGFLESEEIKNLAFDNQWILLVVTWHVQRRVLTEEISYEQMNSCILYPGIVSRGRRR